MDNNRNELLVRLEEAGKKELNIFKDKIASTYREMSTDHPIDLHIFRAALVDTIIKQGVPNFVALTVAEFGIEYLESNVINGGDSV